MALLRPSGAEVLFAAIGLDGVEDHELGPIAMVHASVALARRQDRDNARSLVAKAVEHATTANARWETALWSSATAWFVGDIDLAGTLTYDAVDLAEGAVEPRALLIARSFASAIAAQPGDSEHAARLRQALPARVPSSLLQAMIVGARFAEPAAVGDVDEAVDLAFEAVGQARRAGNRWAAAHVFLEAAIVAIDVIEPERMLALLAEFMTEWRQANDLGRLGRSLLYCAHGLAAFGEPDRAAELLGADVQPSPAEGLLRTELVAELEISLGRGQFDRLQGLGHDTPIRALADRAILAMNHRL